MKNKTILPPCDMQFIGVDFDDKFNLKDIEDLKIHKKIEPINIIFKNVDINMDVLKEIGKVSISSIYERLSLIEHVKYKIIILFNKIFHNEDSK